MDNEIGWENAQIKQAAGRIAAEEKHITKDFHLGGTTTGVLKDILLQVMQGEFVSVTGPSGSGKSTPLYVLGGPDAPTGDQVLLDGTDISWFGDKKMSRIRWQSTGFIFQFYNFIPSLDMERNILLSLLLDGKKMEQCQERLERILEAAGLTECRKHIPHELPGGQQQRVAITRALAGKPAIPFTDEPTGSLDSWTGAGVTNLSWEVNQNIGQTIIMVTHSPETAKSGGRIIIVQDGVFVWEEDIQTSFSTI